MLRRDWRKLKNVIFALSFVSASLLSASFASAATGVPGDYDGDGLTDTTVVRTEAGQVVWYIRQANANTLRVPFGLNGNGFDDDILSADYNGDGKFEPGVIRAHQGLLHWFFMNKDGSATQIQWGLNGDQVLTGSFDNDSAADVVAVRTEANQQRWYFRYSSGGEASVYWGLAGDMPFSGDLDGDGKDDQIVVRKQDGYLWWFVRSLKGTVIGPIQWGLSADMLLPPYDVNGDGYDDLIVVREEKGVLVHYIRWMGPVSKAVGATTLPFGLKGDVPFIGSFLAQKGGQLSAYRINKGAVNTVYVAGIGQWPFGLDGDDFVNPSGMVMHMPAKPVTDNPVVTPVDPEPSNDSDLSKVCSRISGISSGVLYKPASNDSGPPREGKPGMMFKSQKPSDGCVEIYAADGSQVSRFGVYTWAGKYGARFYSGWGCGDLKTGGQIAAAATRAAGKASVYAHLGGGRCIGPMNPTSRNGSL